MQFNIKKIFSGVLAFLECYSASRLYGTWWTLPGVSPLCNPSLLSSWEPGSSWSYPQEEVRAVGKIGYLYAIEKCLLSITLSYVSRQPKGDSGLF